MSCFFPSRSSHILYKSEIIWNVLQSTPSGPVTVRGKIEGLTPGQHGFHIHQMGDTSDGCKSMKGHFNPLQLSHGAPGDTYRHVGDLGNILADEKGVAVIDMEDKLLSLTGINNILARGVVIHAGMDDMGKVSCEVSGVDENLPTRDWRRYCFMKWIWDTVSQLISTKQTKDCIY